MSFNDFCSEATICRRKSTIAEETARKSIQFQAVWKYPFGCPGANFAGFCHRP